MSETDFKKSKNLLNFNSTLNNNIYNEKIWNKTIMEYLYPICIFKNNKKESEEIKKMKYRIIISKKEKEFRDKLINNNRNNNNIKKSLSTKILLPSNNINNNINNNNNLIVKKNNYITEKKFIRSKSTPMYPYCKEENIYNKKKYLSQIEKRGNFYNKKYITFLQRRALNHICLSIPLKKNNEINKNNNNNNISNPNPPISNRLPELKKFLNNRIIAINKNKGEIDDYFNINKKDNINKFNNNDNYKEFKFHIFHDKNGFERELSKPYERNLKMTKEKIRDLKIMASINKIKDPEIIQKYRNILHN